MDESEHLELDFGGERLLRCDDPALGLRAVIAIDDTTLGPGLGGVRYRPYPDDRAGVVECARLAAGMTLKNAFAGLPYGGAKSVIFDDGPVSDRRALMRRFGEFVAATGGAYLPGVDMGTSAADLAMVEAAGAEVSCAREDPSPWTAIGVHAAIRAARAADDRGVAGARVLVQGAGHVGAELARLLAADGARVLVSDVDLARAAQLARDVGGEVVAPQDAVAADCDVLAPCAAARIINRHTVAALRCRIVAGSANDTLADRGCAEALAARGIVYVPDFVANAGGVIEVHARRAGWDEQRARSETLAIGDRVAAILERARRGAVTPLAVAESRAARRLERARARTDQVGAPA